ncbi:YaaC family protein [Nocardiopsis metallicus]|uniref:YaaC n=1 Tax=Nocardiopsis metallicus TaxID=179819 RepID=A0A840WIZ2_9ACTN|nr:YaaC family protein [Nocardiopsis metallicus]MBB5491506.1 hypothetical protein [Nocardiopsis metallicus]
MDSDEEWAGLRATRAAPPAPAQQSADRKATYQFALEQAEQLFRQARLASPATRPLTLFYGLSQAGRSIAAAAANAPGDEWKLKGHGIGTTASTLSGPLENVQVHTDKNGSFVRLSELLESPLWSKADQVRLHVLWDSVPEAGRWSLRPDTSTWTRPLHVDVSSIGDGGSSRPTTMVRPLPPSLISTTDHETLHAFLRSYPDTRGCAYNVLGQDSESRPSYQPSHDGTGSLVLQWPELKAERYQNRRDFVCARTRSYRGEEFFFPTPVSGSDRGIHPLMAWWAVLFTLSILARYQPVEWARHIDVDNSEYAVPIEELLRAALTVLPELIVEIIDDVSR